MYSWWLAYQCGRKTCTCLAKSQTNKQLFIWIQKSHPLHVEISKLWKGDKVGVSYFCYFFFSLWQSLLSAKMQHHQCLSGDAERKCALLFCYLCVPLHRGSQKLIALCLWVYVSESSRIFLTLIKINMIIRMWALLWYKFPSTVCRGGTGQP